MTLTLSRPELLPESPTPDSLHASYLAGMAEVATGVLQGTGGVLRSINVSASMIAATVRHSRAESIGKVAELLLHHEGRLAKFLEEDPKGRQVPRLLERFARERIEEREQLLAEIRQLQEDVHLVREIISTQKAYTTAAGVVERLDLASLVEEAVRCRASTLAKLRVQVEFQSVPHVLAQREKVMQILAVLVDSARSTRGEEAKTSEMIALNLEQASPEFVRLIVKGDTAGMPRRSLARRLSQSSGSPHGFSLHAAATAAGEMGGYLSGHSEGEGREISFSLELPAAPK